MTPMPNEGVQFEHHFIVCSDVRRWTFDNGRVDLTSAIDGAVYTYRRALFGHDATLTRDRQLVLEIKRGVFVRRGETELTGDDGDPIGRALEGSTLQVIPFQEVEFNIEPADLSLDRARDSRFLFSDAESRGGVCGRIEKLSLLNSVLEVKLAGKIPQPIALFSAWWMWRRWERTRKLA